MTRPAGEVDRQCFEIDTEHLHTQYEVATANLLPQQLAVHVCGANVVHLQDACLKGHLTPKNTAYYKQTMYCSLAWEKSAQPWPGPAKAYLLQVAWLWPACLQLQLRHQQLYDCCILMVRSLAQLKRADLQSSQQSFYICCPAVLGHARLRQQLRGHHR